MWLWNSDVQYISFHSLMWHIHSFHRLTFACQALWWEGRGLCRRWTFAVAEPSFRKTSVSGCAGTTGGDQGSLFFHHFWIRDSSPFSSVGGTNSDLCSIRYRLKSGDFYTGSGALCSSYCFPFGPGSNDGCWKSGIQGRESFWKATSILDLSVARNHADAGRRSACFRWIWISEFSPASMEQHSEVHSWDDQRAGVCAEA